VSDLAEAAAPQASQPRHPSLLRDRSGGQRVTNIELFFDLVYVFAVTQLSHYLLHDTNVRGRTAGRAAAGHGLARLGLHDLGD
jgi:low temperature requirement protein LtrA